MVWGDGLGVMERPELFIKTCDKAHSHGPVSVKDANSSFYSFSVYFNCPPDPFTTFCAHEELADVAFKLCLQSLAGITDYESKSCPANTRQA